MSKAWDGVIKIPISGRSSKPRTTGITMIIDKGLGLERVSDLLETAGDYIDIIKLTFGTSAFYDEDYLQRKNKLITSYEVDVMPGGTFLEVAYWQDNLSSYLKRAKKLGFTAIEVSDGTIDIPLPHRQEIIKQALDQGFKVITEVGKKDPKQALPISLTHELINTDAESGAFKVIIEAREAGRGVGIYDSSGQIKEDEIDNIVAGVDNPEILLWEAPLKNQQQALIMRWGVNVNLGNIPPDEILALEALRQGLRGDTLRQSYRQGQDKT